MTLLQTRMLSHKHVQSVPFLGLGGPAPCLWLWALVAWEQSPHVGLQGVRLLGPLRVQDVAVKEEKLLPSGVEAGLHLVPLH